MLASMASTRTRRLDMDAMYVARAPSLIIRASTHAGAATFMPTPTARKP